MSADDAFSEVLQITRLIVPLHIIADDDRLVVGAVGPFDTGAALRALPSDN